MLWISKMRFEVTPDGDVAIYNNILSPEILATIAKLAIDYRSDPMQYDPTAWADFAESIEKKGEYGSTIGSVAVKIPGGLIVKISKRKKNNEISYSVGYYLGKLYLDTQIMLEAYYNLITSGMRETYERTYTIFDKEHSVDITVADVSISMAPSDDPDQYIVIEDPEVWMPRVLILGLLPQGELERIYEFLYNR